MNGGRAEYADDRPSRLVSADDSTLTEKAAKVMHAAHEVRLMAQTIENRLWPTPPNATKDQAEPEPNALPWMLESADKSLRAAHEALNRINSRL